MASRNPSVHASSVVSNQIFVIISDTMNEMKVVMPFYLAKDYVSFSECGFFRYWLTDDGLTRLEQGEHGISDTSYLASFTIQQMVACFLVFVSAISKFSHLILK